ncbi:hypothetical protein CTheo_3680 [Ceratobasidium theobromae]|uniref:Uncharacterized protein n=1 Tax=Ceratobasidium theobromae TaxID=1582974 RepID=A0A5N5QMZ3_9AGAM|nr:hypothetical protein CTheo_3680 [Ceratobasidium theobromae]
MPRPQQPLEFSHDSRRTRFPAVMAIIRLDQSKSYPLAPTLESFTNLSAEPSHAHTIDNLATQQPRETTPI